MGMGHGGMAGPGVKYETEREEASFLRRVVYVLCVACVSDEPSVTVFL